MGAEENKAVVRRYIEAFNTGDFAAAAAEFAPGAVVHGVLADGGVEQARQIWEQLRAAFPDHHNAAGELLGEGDRSVEVRLTDRGTFHRGTVPGCGRHRTAVRDHRDGMVPVYRRKISERWTARDSGAMLGQLGVTPAR